MKLRADEILVNRGYIESRSKARALIEEGKVEIGGKLVDKASRRYDDFSVIDIKGDSRTLKFVSRGGLKLEGYLEYYSVDVRGLEVLDLGASTGGFTDCLLQRGAKSSICVDVGSGQLHERLRNDARVKNMEKKDARDLRLGDFGGKRFKFVCGDMSFISLEKVLGSVWDLVEEGGLIVCLVKPQFEVSLDILRRGKGIVRDDIEREKALDKIIKFAVENLRGSEVHGRMESVISGGDGNREYLLGIKKVKDFA